MQKKRYTKEISVPNYKQFDSKWADSVTSNGGTMKAEGCAITSAAIVLNVSPDRHLKEMKEIQSDCPYYWQVAASKYNKTHTQISGNWEYLKAKIWTYIYREGIPVIIKLSNSKETHFIVASGIDGDMTIINSMPAMSSFNESMIKVKDPGSNYNKTLSDVLQKYSSMHRLDIFK